MGQRGPAKRPQALEDLMGRPGKRPRNNHEPQFEALHERTRAPEHLGEIGAREWRRIVPLLSRAGLLTKVDRVALEVYCEAYDTWVRCAEVLKRGMTYKSDKGNVVALPHANLKIAAANAIAAFCAKFGMTPSDRCRMQVFGDSSHEVEDPMEALLRQAGAKPDLKLLDGGK